MIFNQTKKKKTILVSRSFTLAEAEMLLCSLSLTELFFCECDGLSSSIKTHLCDTPSLWFTLLSTHTELSVSQYVLYSSPHI